MGFKLSPVLWKKVKPALSAGRVQSVAVRLIVEREREIQQFKSEESYRVVALFTPANSKEGTEIKAELNQRFKNKEEATRFLENCKDAAFTIRDIATRPQKRNTSGSVHHFHATTGGGSQARFYRGTNHDDSPTLV